MSDENAPPMVLTGPDGKSFLVTRDQGMKEIAGLGVVDTGRLRDSMQAGKVTIAGREFSIAPASLLDILANMRRGAQIILPKDSAQIVMGCGIGPGMTVFEAGTGSGALTIALAHFVGPEGKVVTYEANPKHAKNAIANIKLSGLGARVEMREADASGCTDESVYDAAVLDMPEPWSVIDVVTRALKLHGYLCAYVPTMNQAEAAIKAMRERGYKGTHVLENIQREIVVGTGGTRPSFEMLGHTGYLCFGRKSSP